MAEADGQEKTEQPTGKRLNQARSRGQLPRSKELATSLVLLAGMCGLLMVGRRLGVSLIEVFQHSFSVERAALFDPNSMLKILVENMQSLAVPMAIFFAIMVVASVLGTTLLGGYNFTTETMMPNFSKLNPINGLKRMMGVQGLIEIVKSIFKVLFIGVLAWFLIMGRLPKIMALSEHQFPDAIYDALSLCIWAAIGICCAMLPVVLIDVPFQRWNYTRELRMTKQEVKDEFKDAEGKPEVKSKLRRMQFEMANRRMMAAVPKADVVVTNPTHYAVALKYDKNRAGAAPMVVAKGVDDVAMKIREIAAEYNIVTVSSPPLARAIYHTTRLDSEIPEGLFVAVAQVLAYVFQLQAFQHGKGQRPKKLADELPIPDEYRY